MTKDRFASYTAGPGQPAVTIVDIAPDDTMDLEQVLSGLNVETPGRVQVTTRDGAIGTVFVAAGTVFPLRVTKVWATGTTATGIRGLI